MAQVSRTKKAARPDEEDRLSALPDGPLQHILGFLPAHEVVRTSVLAPRWLHIWKSVRRLHITNPMDSDEDDDNDDALREFVNPLFLLRGHGILDEVKFDYDPNFHEETDIWVKHALLCQAKVLNVHPRCGLLMILGGSPLVSRHLRKLVLVSVIVRDKFLEFASCPALEVLEMTHCHIGTQILSQSMKLLRIESSCLNHYGNRIRISLPSLIWLELNNFEGKAPFLESMPSLETASVKPSLKVWDSCKKGDSWECCGICADCCGNDDHKGSCLLLGGLSSAVNLELTAYSGMFVFRRDLNWCPTFSKLKKLLLNDWCVAVDLYALVCILKHSPLLENLTLQLRKMQRPQFTATIERKDISMEKSALISERLKIVKIKCEEVDDRVCKLLKFLSTLDIEVTIKRTENVVVGE